MTKSRSRWDPIGKARTALFGKREGEDILQTTSVRVLGNLGYITLADKALEAVSQTSSLLIAATMATTGGLLYVTNKALSAVNDKLKENYQATKKSIFGLRGTAIMAGALTFGSIPFGSYNAVSNLASTGKNIITTTAQSALDLGKDITNGVVNLYDNQITQEAEQLDFAFARTGPACKPSDRGSARIAPITGINMGNVLRRNYTGISGIATGDEVVDYDQQMRKMWDYKIRRSNNSVVNEVSDTQVRDYINGTPEPSSVDQVLDNTREAMCEIQSTIDWNQVQRLMRGKGARISDNGMRVVKEIAESLDERDMIAYGLNELMPGLNGEENLSIFQHGLEQAGEDYWLLIPAHADNLTSFGLYQFTSHAVFDAPRNGEQTQDGASVVNRALPQQFRIPGSMKLLEGDDHHKAAYLFSIYNIARMVSKLNQPQVNTLDRVHADSKDDIVTFLGAAHHAPRHGYESAVRWLDNNAASPFRISCSQRVIDECKKTLVNYEAVRAATQ